MNPNECYSVLNQGHAATHEFQSSSVSANIDPYLYMHVKYNYSCVLGRARV